MAVEGIYTAYMSGVSGQSMAMFVFREGKIAGADVGGLIFRGNYTVTLGRVQGSLTYVMPVGSSSITGAIFENRSEEVNVMIDLPEEIDPNVTYRIETPIGPVNAKFVKNVSLG